jgi:serine O-acetyltransferase
MTRDRNWEADLARYPSRPFLREQSIWAVWIYRFGRRMSSRRPGLLQWIALKIYWLTYRLIETASGITLPVTADIGPGLRIWHFGNIIIHADVVIGSNCTLRQGVTIGNRHQDGPVPKIGDNVDFGAYAQILGGVTIGNNCTIGAMSVLLVDMPEGTTAVGNPARIIKS